MAKKKWYQKKEFQDLQREWYAKLKEDDFKDIEDIEWETGDAMPRLYGPSSGDLTRPSKRVLDNGTTLKSENRILNILEAQEYYSLARKHYWEMPGGVDKHIWKLHADGYSNPKIFKALGHLYEDLTQGYVTRIVKREREKILPKR